MALAEVSIEVWASAAAFFIGLIITTFCVPFVARRTMQAGVVGTDIHKPYKPAIPEMGGLSILVGLGAMVTISMLILPDYAVTFIAFLSVAFIAGMIGVIDDLRRLGPLIKPVLTAFAFLPLFLLGIYDPRPVLPFIGRVRLTIVYPLLLPLAVAVPANAVNMMDPVNGVMAGTCSIVAFVMFVCAVILGRWEVAVLCAGLLGCLLAFYRYNRFPARVFSGDVGSLAVGASIGALAVIGHLEVVGIVALMPHIMNAFYGLSSIGRLYERGEVSARPVRLLDNGRLAASSDPKAPITLTRTILADGPLGENSIARVFFILSSFSGVLAILTALLTVMVV